MGKDRGQERGAELQTRAGGRGHAGARAHAGGWAARRHFWRAVTGVHGGAAVQLSRRARRRKPGRATQWMSTNNEAEKVDSTVAMSRLSGGRGWKNKREKLREEGDRSAGSGRGARCECGRRDARGGDLRTRTGDEDGGKQAAWRRGRGDDGRCEWAW